MSDLTSIFGGPWSPPPAPLAPASPEQQLAEAMIAAGLTPPNEILLDGKLHRFQSGTKGGAGHSDKAGWYIAFGDGVPAGRFGCWRAGIDHIWRADVGRQLSPAEEMAHVRRLAEAQAARNAAMERRHEVAENDVATIWSQAAAANEDHPYLKRKGVQPHGARVTGDGRLIVPLYDQDGKLSSLQYIEEVPGNQSKKSYHGGGQVRGKFWVIGEFDTSGPIYIAEGFATAATIHEVTQRPTVVAYSAGGLVQATEIIRNKFGPTQDIVIVADNDASGVGQQYAEQASAKYGARIVVPPMQGDANDYQQAGHDLASLLLPQVGSAIIDKLHVVFGDQLGTEYEAPDELVEGLMTIGQLIVLYGDSNSGKTFFAISIATAIATGTECYGRKTDPGLVIYLASESPGSVRSRLQAIKKYYGCSLENLAMVPVPLNFYTGPQDANDIIELVREVERSKGKKVRLIIGDTLARMSAGANENSGEDMGPVMARFDYVAVATGAAVMIIHHTGKDSAKGARGWSGIRAHIDTEIEISAQEGGSRIASITKQRELPSRGDAIPFRLDIVEMGVTKFGSPATTCVAIPDDAAPAPGKKMSKTLQKHISLLGRAFWSGGAEQREGAPYVSRSAMRDFLIADGATQRAAQNQMDPTRNDNFIGQLLNAGVIEDFEHGWIIVDDTLASSLLIQRQGKK